MDGGAELGVEFSSCSDLFCSLWGGGAPVLRVPWTSSPRQKIENLEEFRNLRKLDLSGNEITRIENLSEVPSLQLLDLSHNLVERIEGLSRLSHLLELNLSHNRISRLPRGEALRSLHKLHTLRLSGNSIDSVGVLVPENPPIPFFVRQMGPFFFLLFWWMESLTSLFFFCLFLHCFLVGLHDCSTTLTTHAAS